MDKRINKYKNYLILLCQLAAALSMGVAGWAWADSHGQRFGIDSVKYENENLIVKGFGAGEEREVIIRDAESGSEIGRVQSEDEGEFRFKANGLASLPCLISAQRYDGSLMVTGYTERAPESCGGNPDRSPADSENSEPPSDPEWFESHRSRFSEYEGTKTCLSCHMEEAMTAHNSVHYQWKGDASETVGLMDFEAGKMGGINDFCIYPDINWIGKLTTVNGEQVDGGCAKCHAGLGAKPTPEPTQAQLENIDCLVCHSDQYKRKVERVGDQFRFVPDTGNMAVSLYEAAVDVGRPSKDSCLNCHTKAGGGNNFKRGDIEEAHRDPDRSFDVHMASKEKGGAGLSCLDCHEASEHRIAGRGSDLRPRESTAEVSCAKCHSNRPHHEENLDRHTARVNCTVCHIPYFAKVAPTDMNRDWSVPGDLVPEKGLYEPHHEKGTQVVPEYRFFNGTSYFYQFGDPAVPGENGRVVMSEPLGDIQDPNAKIHAFKHHLAVQPADAQSGNLLPLKIGKFFESGQLDSEDPKKSAVRLGAEAVGWGYQGHTFVETERYMGLFHEVAPKSQALECNSCHGGDRLDFKALGYTPRSSRNGRPLCSSCHEDESDEWSGSEKFRKIHHKHVDDKKLDCGSCHHFSGAGNH